MRSKGRTLGKTIKVLILTCMWGNMWAVRTERKEACGPDVKPLQLVCAQSERVLRDNSRKHPLDIVTSCLGFSISVASHLGSCCLFLPSLSCPMAGHPGAQPWRWVSQPWQTDRVVLCFFSSLFGFPLFSLEKHHRSTYLGRQGFVTPTSPWFPRAAVALIPADAIST